MRGCRTQTSGWTVSLSIILGVSFRCCLSACTWMHHSLWLLMAEWSSTPCAQRSLSNRASCSTFGCFHLGLLWSSCFRHQCLNREDQFTVSEIMPKSTLSGSPGGWLRNCRLAFQGGSTILQSSQQHIVQSLCVLSPCFYPAHSSGCVSRGFHVHLSDG